jgi:hypothetical protein
MGKSAGRRAYEAYDQLPEGVKRQANKVIRLGAKATKGFRNRKVIESRGRAWVEAQRRKIGKHAPKLRR